MVKKVKREIQTDTHQMTRKDMPKVLDIENESEFPWEEKDFETCSYSHMVAKNKKRVVGFMVYKRYTECIYIAKFAVAASMHRHGIGRRMAAALINKLSIQYQTRLVLEIRETNLPAQLFFREMDFRITLPIMKCCFLPTGEDIYRMQYILQPECNPLYRPKNRISRLYYTSE